MELMDFAAKVAQAIRDQRGRVTRIIVDEPDDGIGPANTYHVRVEDSVRWAEQWVSCYVLAEKDCDRYITAVVERVLWHKKHGDPVAMHRPARLAKD